MKKKTQKKKKKYKNLILLVLGVIVFSLIFIFPTSNIEQKMLQKQEIEGRKSFVSFSPSDTRGIGFEYLDSLGNIVNEGSATVIHTWNTKDDYFYNKTSGIQFSNHFQEYWAHNIFCAGYKNSSNDWVYDCNDALPFNWNIKTDNLTYVNYTGWRDKTIEGKTVRLGLRYHLKLDDENLSIQPSVENIGDSNITNDLGFAWRINNIRIGNDEEDDRILINGTEYLLNNSLDIGFLNMTSRIEEGMVNQTCWDECTGNETCEDSCYLGENVSYLATPYYRVRDASTQEYLRLNWNKNLNYRVRIKSKEQQYNSPITLEINVGSLTVGQQKTTTIYWIDALESAFFDSFEDGSAWNNWTESGGGQWLNSENGGCGIGSCADGSWCACAENIGVDTALLTMTNAVDLTSYLDCILNYSVWVDSSFDTGEYVYINVTDSGGSSVNIFSATNGDKDDSTWHSYEYNITSGVGLNANFKVSVESYGNDNNEEAGFDAVNISCTIDTINPDINITSPINNTNTTDATIDVEYTRSDANGIGSCWWSNDTLLENFSLGTEGSCVNITNITWDDGQHNVTVWVNDSVGNENYSTISFDIFTGTLNVNITYPLNNSNFSQSDTNLTINATVTCVGGSCGTVYALARYNLTINPDTDINITGGASPFYVLDQEGTYTGYHFDTSGEGGNPYGITTDGTYIWTIDVIGKEVYKYYKNGTNISSFDTSGESDFPYGITTDGTYIWIVDLIADEVYKYGIDGTYTEDHFDTSGEGDAPVGITTDGTYIWTIDSGDDEVYKYGIDGTYTEDHFDTSGEGDFHGGITTDGTYIWIVEEGDAKVDKYFVNGTFISSFDVSGEGGNPNGITTDGIYIYTSRYIADEVHEYGPLLQNPKTKMSRLGTQLNQGESWNVSWTLNVTSADTESFLIDVNFSSSYGDALVPDNNTVDRQVNLNPGAPPPDNEYPEFSEYWDTNATLLGSGIGLFNATVNLTNGTVWLEIDGNNISASNNSGDIKVFNTTYTFASAGTYPYKWISWGNGTSTLFNVSETQSYTVNASVDTCTYGGSGTWNLDCSDNCIWGSNVTVDGNITITGTGTLSLKEWFIFTGTNRYFHLNPTCEFGISSGGGFTSA